MPQATHRPEDLAAAIKRLAADVGFADCGITTAEPFERFARAVRRRMERFPEAAGLYEPMLARADVRTRKPWARSVVVCVRRYGKYAIPDGLDEHIGRNYLFDRRVEPCPDHPLPRRMTDGLRALHLRVGKGGCPDRWAAARAGVARFGRSCFACSPTCGTWINVECYLVDAELPPDEPTCEPACPTGCRACIDACPTGAIVEPFTMRMDRCVAYLTYHAPEPIAPDLWERMGPWIYGCDVCQRVCPLNEGKWEPLERAHWLEAVADKLTPRALAEMDEPTYRRVVHPRFWYIAADDVERWRRNARRALEAKGA